MVINDPPAAQIPTGGYVQSPPGILVPRGLCGRGGCVFLAHHHSLHSWMQGAPEPIHSETGATDASA